VTAKVRFLMLERAKERNVWEMLSNPEKKWGRENWSIYQFNNDEPLSKDIYFPRPDCYKVMNGLLGWPGKSCLAGVKSDVLEHSG
jgi:hypothetical protein